MLNLEVYILHSRDQCGVKQTNKKTHWNRFSRRVRQSVCVHVCVRPVDLWRKKMYTLLRRNAYSFAEITAVGVSCILLAQWFPTSESCLKAFRKVMTMMYLARLPYSYSPHIFSYCLHVMLVLWGLDLHEFCMQPVLQIIAHWWRDVPFKDTCVAFQPADPGGFHLPVKKYLPPICWNWGWIQAECCVVGQQQCLAQDTMKCPFSSLCPKQIPC